MILARDRVDETPSALGGPEAELLEGSGGGAALWCGRAATALFFAYRLALREFPTAGSEVILPSLSCATPANAACLAGLQPRFADVEPDTGLLSLESAKARWTERTRALVFIHLYGQTADLTELAAWCRSKGVFLIEDNAQALGARASSRPVGSWGDASVYSFNPTKIIEAGGGALVVRGPDLRARLQREVASLPALAEASAQDAVQLALSYRNVHHGLVALLRLRPEYKVDELFLRVRAAFDPLLWRPLRDPEPLAAAWGTLPTVLRHRAENAELYSNALAGGPWRLLDGWRTSGVCWRYSLLSEQPTRLVELSDAVRRDGFHVSNLYWPVSQFFRSTDTCPNADAFARRIVNLWVDASVSPETVNACATSLRRRASEMRGRGP